MTDSIKQEVYGMSKWPTDCSSERLSSLGMSPDEIVAEYHVWENKYDTDTKAFLQHFHDYISTQFGMPCGEHEEGCPVCEMWALYTKAQEYLK